MSTEKQESLKVIIAEQKQDLDYLLHIYNRARAIEGLLLTATFGILGYLYSNPKNFGEKTSISERVFLPHEDYGKVIYFIAVAFFAYSLIKLTLLVFGKHPWMTSYEIPKDNYANSLNETLEYYKNRNDKCLEYNGDKYYKRKETLNFLFYSILISAIILIVIKTLN